MVTSLASSSRPESTGKACGGGMAGDVQAVVFDLDGVLIDSEQLWDVVRRGLADEAGRPWPAEATRAMQGMSTAEWSAYLTDAVGIPGEPQEVAVTVIDRMAACYDVRLPLLPGAVKVVERLARRWPLGLASSSPRRLIDTVLAAAGLAQRFQVSVSTEEVAAGKPSPAVYQTVVQRLGVDPARQSRSRTRATGCGRPLLPAWGGSRCLIRPFRPPRVGWRWPACW